MDTVEILIQGEGWVRIGRKEVESWLKRAAFIRHYDLLETPRHRVTMSDLATPSFLAAVPMFKKLLDGLSGTEGRPSAEDATERITEALRKIPDGLDLWDWPDTEANREDLRQLLSLCRALLADFGPPKITKLLHLKRPMLIPIIDDRVRRTWNPGAVQSWTVDELLEVSFRMGKELGDRRSGLDFLKAVAGDLGWPYNSLSRLRLYDVVFWWRTEGVGS